MSHSERRIHVQTSVSWMSELLPHFFRHYQALGVDHHVVMVSRHRESDVPERVEAVARSMGLDYTLVETPRAPKDSPSIARIG